MIVIPTPATDFRLPTTATCSGSCRRAVISTRGGDIVTEIELICLAEVERQCGVV
jgi:hypothetical protein